MHGTTDAARELMCLFCAGGDMGDLLEPFTPLSAGVVKAVSLNKC